MKTIYSNEAIDNSPSIFLAGPSPRSAIISSWRPHALEIIETLKFDGAVIIPEYRDHEEPVDDYLAQVEWEHDGLEKAWVLAFWIPRHLEFFPGFTTNVEFGRYVGRKPVVYGRPVDAPKNRYLDWYYKKMTEREPLKTLADTMKYAVTMLEKA